MGQPCHADCERLWQYYFCITPPCVDLMLVECWANFLDGGSAQKQYLVIQTTPRVCYNFSKYFPNKSDQHEALTQRWGNDGPPLQRVAQH